MVIGSSTIDLFLDIDKSFTKIEDRNVSFRLGDKIPSEIRKLTLGGNGANVSVGLTRLEIPTTFYTYLGDDILSREIEEGLTREGVELKAERYKQKSSSLSIIFGFDRDRIIFSHHEVRDYTFYPDSIGAGVDSNTKFDFIFLSSIGDHWENAYKQILEFANKTNTPLVFSPGTHQLENINETVKLIIKASKIFFSNKEEAEIVLGKPAGSDIKELLNGIKKLGAEVVSITDGARGAYAIDGSNNCFKIGPAPSEGHEKTGAGDAYAAALFAAYLEKSDVPTAMIRGTLNSSGVMQEIGAQSGLLKKQELDRKLSENNNLKAGRI